MTAKRKAIGGLEIDPTLYDVVADIAQGTGIGAELFFEKLGAIIDEMAPRNAELLEKRREFEQQINDFFADKQNQANNFDAAAYDIFLKDIGYITPENHENFTVTTENVASEIASLNGPQLVCPVDKPRLALNANNARWGSLFAATYGQPGDQNVIDEEGGKGFADGYNAERGAAVIARVHHELDIIIPLENDEKFSDVRTFKLTDNGATLIAALKDGSESQLQAQECYVGYRGDKEAPNSIMLKHNGLHIELRTKADTAMEKNVAAQNGSQPFYDVQMESAVSTIMDMEDSVSAVDAEDKAAGYRSWAGLMRRNLTEDVTKGGKTFARTMNEDKIFTSKTGENITLSGGSKLMVRNVGTHLYSDVITKNGAPIPEGFLDAMVSALAAMHERNRDGGDQSIYIVKPKMHGPEEVAETCKLFAHVEQTLGLPKNTIKIGIMDEEQRTSVNLRESIRAAKDRVFFINTGFLDRTGDLIHTASAAGVMKAKEDIQLSPWLQAYEQNNVAQGLDASLQKSGQIGKGMWAFSSDKAGLLEKKTNHPKAGANTAWVPNPAAATLHALHYHQINVDEIQADIAGELPHIQTKDILQLPLLGHGTEPKNLQDKLDEYAQSILGYVVPWVNDGVGCSAIPNFQDVKLMEDLATLRIGSQLLGNWHEHSIIDAEQIVKSFAKMAAKVDKQNQGTLSYTPMIGNFEGPAFQAALTLVFHAKILQNGYTEAPLRAARKDVKNHVEGAYRGGDIAQWLEKYGPADRSTER